jgi:3-oxoacyl-[acyl-carrier protein] reductase
MPRRVAAARDLEQTLAAPPSQSGFSGSRLFEARPRITRTAPPARRAPRKRAALSGRRAPARAARAQAGADVDRLVGEAARALCGIDILVTVVGGQLAFVPAARIHEITEEDWNLMFDVNLHYVARALRATLRVFLEQATGGTIVSVGPITAVAGSPRQAAYGAAKAGLASLARSVAAEYSGDGIRMNVVSCGPVATPVAEAAQALAELDWIPMGRAASSQQVADAAVFLAFPLSSYLSGQSLVLDGGATAIGPSPGPRRRSRPPRKTGPI